MLKLHESESLVKREILGCPFTHATWQSFATRHIRPSYNCRSYYTTTIMDCDNPVNRKLVKITGTGAATIAIQQTISMYGPLDLPQPRLKQSTVLE